MSDGFLGRWSRRKLEAKEGKPIPDEPAAAVPTVPSNAQSSPTGANATAPPPPSTAASLPTAATANPAAVPPPTLEDVSALTAESDFSRFAAREVAPEVKNAAMKKLFADPRYNVMDGLDVYVDDYSKPQPIAPTVLRQLASAKFLRLFEQEQREAEEAARRPRDVADNPGSQSVAQCDRTCASVPEPIDHAHPDLRLQQDDAAAGDDPGQGPG